LQSKKSYKYIEEKNPHQILELKLVFQTKYDATKLSNWKNG